MSNTITLSDADVNRLSLALGGRIERMEPCEYQSASMAHEVEHHRRLLDRLRSLPETSNATVALDNLHQRQRLDAVEALLVELCKVIEKHGQDWPFGCGNAK